MTIEGTVVVNGVVASCYVFPDHNLAHTGMMPIRWYPKLMEWLFDVEDGFLGYVMVAENLGSWMLPFNFIY